MKEAILQFFEQNPNMAVLSSFVFSVVIAFIGLIPSFVITAANIHFFGFWEGLIITFIGEATGVLLAFFLYRKGFKEGVTHKLEKHPKAKRLLEADFRDAFWLIFSLRLIPVVPAGLVTFTAAMGRISAAGFVTAGMLGKLPSLFLEAYAVYQVVHFGWQGKVILVVLAIVLLYFVIRHIVRSKK
ncbi:MAG TPA: VTT domain-containing protein [Flavisolibacter sp.]|nr:VTT domain-containing protein [Flavisolibacter sp.]